MQAEAAAKLQEQHRQDAAKLRRERDALDRQAAAITKLPTQKERREVCCLLCGSPHHGNALADHLQTSASHAGAPHCECVFRCVSGSLSSSTLRQVGSLRSNTGPSVPYSACESRPDRVQPHILQADPNQRPPSPLHCGSGCLTYQPSASQLESLEAIVEQERRARKAREARHKLECDRLRRQIGDLQARRHVSRVQMLGCACGFRI